MLKKIMLILVAATLSHAAFADEPPVPPVAALAVCVAGQVSTDEHPCLKAGLSP